MKNKIVIWGTNEADEKLLIALELQANEGKVLLYTFPEAIASEEFVNKMMSEWREGSEVEFPEGHTSVERALSVTESLLPDELKVERGDVIHRAQTEWHFAVLSAKLHQTYQQELEEFKEKVAELSNYDNKIWDGLKSFWDKVQSQSRERNLFREHANHLRDNINLLFEDLKKMRTKVKTEFVAASSVVADEFNAALDEIDARIVAGGSRLNTVFEELKQLQHKYKEARMSNEHRNKIWDRLDNAFKKAKARKFGPSANDGSLAERHDRRLSGLKDALKRMSDSVARDEEELEFQNKKVIHSEGQLEAQIRMAKIKMIEERVVSKRLKLEDMERTMADIERQANIAKNKEAKRAEKETEKRKIAEAKEAVKSEIAAEIKTKATNPPAEKEESLFEAAANVLGDVLFDAIDTAKAVASVVADKAEEAYEKASEKGEDAMDTAKAVATVVKDKAEKAFDIATDEGEDALEKAKAVAKKVMDKAGVALDKAVTEAAEAMDKAVAEANQAIEKAGEKGDGAFGKAKAVASIIADKAEAAFEKAMDKAEESLESFKAKQAAETAKTTEKDGIIIEDVVHKADVAVAEAKEGIIIEDVVHKEDVAEAAKADGIIIEDVVHKKDATEVASADGIIIEDVVHKTAEGESKEKDA